MGAVEQEWLDWPIEADTVGEQHTGGSTMTPKPEILDRRPAARSRIFRIEAIDLRFSNGAARTYERILGGPDSVMVLPLREDAALLLIREYAAGSDAYELGFPKGVVEDGESVIDAANRELREEVGHGARDLRVLHRCSLVPGYIQHATQIVLARDLYPSKAVGDEPEPIQVVPWSLQDIDGLLARPDFTEARGIAALFLLQRFLAHERGSC
jgi:ADP-ribose diphosphatase